MTLDVNSAAGQLNGVYGAIETYLKGVVSHLAGGTPAVLSPVLTQDSGEATALSILSTEKGASDRVGVLVEGVHCLASIVREHNLASLGKIAIYAAAASETSVDAELANVTGAAAASTFQTGV